MHERTYTVLRLRRSVTPEAGASPFAMSIPAAAAAGPDTLEIHKASLSEAERADVRRDPRVMAIAEAMPMSLIAPQEHEVVEPLDAVNWGVAAVGAPDSPFTGDGITVAVLDTGIDADHEAFQGVELIQRNFTTEPLADSNGHGTHCAGTIFGRDVGGVRIGVARGVRRAVIGKVLGQGGGSSSDVAQAIQWAVAQGAHVLSMSLGIDFPGFVDRLVRDRGLDVRPATSIALEQYRANVNLFSALAATIRAQGSFGLGSVVFAAAGNESDRPRYEIAASPPAAGTDVVAIGALARSPEGLRVAGFSNHQVDVAAPGVDIVSARAGGGLRSMSGTSMATPHVAGVAALWAERLRHITGRVESPALMAQVVASGSTEALAPGFEEDDVGTGCVQAPLD